MIWSSLQVGDVNPEQFFCFGSGGVQIDREQAAYVMNADCEISEQI